MKRGNYDINQIKNYLHEMIGELWGEFTYGCGPRSPACLEGRYIYYYFT